MRLSWLLRGSRWRYFHLLQCEKCYKRFPDDAPGIINAVRDTDDEAAQCLDFGGFSGLTRCPACAAPLWQEAVRIARYRRAFD